MFKRVEKKRKKREEEEELGLDNDMREIMGLNDSDSDGSDSESELEQPTSGEEDVEGGDLGDSEGDEEETVLEERIDEQPPMSVHEALKNPIYLISLDPTMHGCILCKGRLLKNQEMVVVHKNAVAHKRRFERFKALAFKTDPGDDGWAVVKASLVQGTREDQSTHQTLSKRALKRQAKQAAIREKRKLHKRLKAKAIAKNSSKKSSEGDAMTGEAAAPSKKTSGSLLSAKRPMKRRKTQQQRAAGSTEKSQEASPESGILKGIEKAGSKNMAPKALVLGEKRKRRQEVK